MGTRFHTRLAKVERVLGRSPDKKMNEVMARVIPLLSRTDQALLPARADGLDNRCERRDGQQGFLDHDSGTDEMKLDADTIP